MTTNYTPTTDEVRDSFMHDDLTGTPDELIAEAFDRWYAAEKAKWQAEAWDEGYRAGADDMSDLRAGRLTFQTITGNPYRQEATR